MTGVVSQTPVPQVTDPSSSIISTVGVTPLQIGKAAKVGLHTGSMFTMPVAVAEPQFDWQVIVYSQ